MTGAPSFFNRVAKSDFRRNHIHYLLNHNGEPVTGTKDLLHVCKEYFTTVFSRPINMTEPSLALSITPCIIEEDNQTISAIPSATNIKQAAFSIHLDKSPGSDAFNALFF